MFSQLSIGILLLLFGIAFPPLLVPGAILIAMFVHNVREAGERPRREVAMKDAAKVAKARQQAHDKAVRFFQ